MALRSYDLDNNTTLASNQHFQQAKAIYNNFIRFHIKKSEIGGRGDETCPLKNLLF